jgi:hypothetical protein
MEDWGTQTLSGRLFSEMISRAKVLAVVEGISKEKSTQPMKTGCQNLVAELLSSYDGCVPDSVDVSTDEASPAKALRPML